MNLENVCEDLARTAWLLREHVGIADITGLANFIADECGGAEESVISSDISGEIIAGLEILSGDECWGPKAAAEGEAMGHCKIGSGDCYWWFNGAETNWQSDEPDWWQSQIKQYAGEDEVEAD
jgi:hypothetical protein